MARAGLGAALEAIPRPALVVTPHGAVRHANAAGAGWLAAHRTEAAAGLSASLAGRRAAPFTCFALAAPGLPGLALLVHRPCDAAAPAAVAADRWRLTRRQRAVLALLGRGLSNRTIAVHLGCAETTVEHHVTEVLRRAGAASRAEPVARLFAPD